MHYLSESVISKMNIERLRALRQAVIAHIHRSERDGYWCCDLRCEWVKDENHTYPNKDADYAYRDLVNKYYDIQVGALLALVKMSQEDVKQGRTMSAHELLASLRARRA